MTVKRIKHIPIGGNRFDLPRSYQLKCHIKLRSRQCGASYGRLRIDEVAPTMTSRCTTPACGSFIHPTEHRGITLREAALIQTFPPSYKFEGGYDQIERQIGNAVPVLLAKAVANSVRTCLEQTSTEGSHPAAFPQFEQAQRRRRVPAQQDLALTVHSQASE